MMSEEKVTLSIIQWLTRNGWFIVCYDFPQSGTGKLLLPNDNPSAKNKGGITPDIVAVKDNTCLFFENKNRFHKPDYEKIHSLITSNNYTRAISRLLQAFSIEKTFYGIGIPSEMHRLSSQTHSHLVNFIVGVKNDFSVEVLYNPLKINFKG